MYLFGLISGSILLALIFHDTFEVMLLPRRVRRKLRFITLLFRYTWNLWSWFAERMALGIRRDMFLSLYGPVRVEFQFRQELESETNRCNVSATYMTQA